MIVKSVQVRGAVFHDGADHCAVSSVHDSAGEGARLCLQLIGRRAFWTLEIDGRRVCSRRIQRRGVAIRAVQISRGPCFGGDSGALSFACVGVESAAGERDLHARIRSLSLMIISFRCRRPYVFSHRGCSLLYGSISCLQVGQRSLHMQLQTIIHCVLSSGHR